MITKAVDKSRIDEFGGYEVEQFTIEELEDKISILKAEKSKTQELLSQKDVELSQKDDVISQNREEISKLKEILHRHGISVPKSI